MAPKAAKPAGAKKASGNHASYQDMIKDAILNLKERNGSSRQAIKKYIRVNNDLGNTTDAAFSTHISRALSQGETNGVFERPKGASGPVKLKKAAPKPAVSKDSKPKTAAKTAAAKPKKATSTKEKKPAAKKATSSKANAAKPRKKADASAAPAVEDKPAVVTGKTKSGRVTKSKAPAAKKTGTAKKPAAKKASAPKKVSAKKEAPAAAAA